MFAFRAGVAALLLLAAFANLARAGDPPAINPFGPPGPAAPRDDAVPGCVELSDGSILVGNIYLTRDTRLKIYDEQLQRQREVPLNAIKQIDCSVKREWVEKEYRFKETTTDEKLFTGRSYPVREYLHTFTLFGGKTITGPVAGIVYVETTQRPTDGGEPAKTERRVLLHKRDKGELGTELKSLVYVKSIKLGKEAHEEGRKAARKGAKRP